MGKGELKHTGHVTSGQQQHVLCFAIRRMNVIGTKVKRGKR
jgi:hypothetical protein